MLLENILIAKKNKQAWRSIINKNIMKENEGYFLI